ncbi:MAG: FkbM family methyltransferase [Candidatus Anaerobiospirillum pullicola]|uniref:FkbM family methyltransferase n=1 Tax=Candidatus Anaerobiospirillum pullicola TaxID=2838451 RepID=A0A948THK4_9GAMM|nr:FkbM family methyltransferase [Candidatus Anaerobiospirillum pullicola]
MLILAAYIPTLTHRELRGFVKVREGDIFLDCGACLGDTALWAYSKGAKTVYSFEPSPANYKYLQLNFKQNHIAEDLAILSAVGKEKGTLPFLLENQQLHAGACRCISEEWAQEIEGSTNADLKKALTRVDCIKLDDFCKERNVTPTFIKMDIEGAELDALQGAAATIKQHKPRLAICLYHNVAHMWEIPAYVKSLVPEYKLYCKKNHPMWEFVLYATVD